MLSVSGYQMMHLVSACLQVAAAGKRMGPSDPDKSRPKPEKLPWCAALPSTLHIANLHLVA